MAVPYHQKGVRIDLTDESIRTESLEQHIYRSFFGGKGLGAYLLYERMQPGANPLGPANHLILTAGPLAGTSFPAASRGVLVTKSPLTGTFLDSSIGGIFAEIFKRCGLDYLDITGKAQRPTVLVVSEGAVRFEDAEDLWGLTTAQTQAALRTRCQDNKAAVVTIGPAGERGVLFASVSCDGRMFGRGGAGAVWGSKNLKAIVFLSHRTHTWKEPAGFVEYCRTMRMKLRLHPLMKKGGAFSEYGTTFTTEFTQEAGVIPTRNWQESQYSGAPALFSDAFARYKVRSVTCPRCPVGCSRVVTLPDGGVVEGPEYETIYAFGSNCAIDDPKAIIMADHLCEQYGMDTISCGCTLAYAMECEERGVKGPAPGLHFGEVDKTLEMVCAIGERTGEGETLGLGVRRIAEMLDPEARRFAMHVKGLELPGYDPRGMKAMALLYATSDRGGCHVRGSSLKSELMGISSVSDRFGYAGKAALAADLHKKYAMMNSYSVCLFAGFVLNEENFAGALSFLFEEPITAEDLLLAGKNIWDLTRSFNCREGFSRADDVLPARLLEDPVSSGPCAGQVVALEDFREMLSEYYELEGWDEEGRPRTSPHTERASAAERS